MAERALADLKVVELGDMVSAPFCGKLLADMGAEVIKVEPPGAGDGSRAYGPFPDGVPHPERSGLYLFLNTSKLGITLDVNTPRGHRVMLRLLEQSDLFIENQEPGATSRWRLDYPSLHSLFPRLVVTSITPFGHNGPYRDLRGTSINCAALAGLSITLGQPERAPLAPPLLYTGYLAGIAGAMGSLVALCARPRTGQGQHVDIAETDVAATFLTGRYITENQFEGTVPRRPHQSVRLYPSGTLRCKDGQVRMNAPQLEQWIRFLEAMGNPAWAENPRYRDRRAMLKDYRHEVDALVEDLLKDRTKEEVLELCLRHRVPTAPIKTIEDVLRDPHLNERDFFAPVTRAEVGTLTHPGPAYRFAETPWAIKQPAPLLGEHNEAIYGGWLGYGAEELAELRQAGVV